MIQTRVYSILDLPSSKEQAEIVQFLFTELGEYGDRKMDIEKACQYALMRRNADGGFILAATEDAKIAGAAVVNKTGMEGYIPENILVYIATHRDSRGKGIGTLLMQKVLELTQGSIALHVEPENPAVQLYRKFGFTNKYLEMRLNKKEGYGVSNL
jgi:GNAT superfamily N-acetyltransferase